MASHIHTQVRTALATALTGLTTTGSRVYLNRVYALRPADLPALRVFLAREEVQPGLASGFYRRELLVQIEAVAKAASGLDDTLDQIGKEVETALVSGLTVGAVAVPLEYLGMTTELDDLDQPVGVRTLNYRAVLHAATPDTLL